MGVQPVDPERPDDAHGQFHRADEILDIGAVAAGIGHGSGIGDGGLVGLTGCRVRQPLPNTLPPSHRVALRTGRSVVKPVSLGSMRSDRGSAWNRARTRSSMPITWEGMVMGRLLVHKMARDG
jgi:hypothetical protein